MYKFDLLFSKCTQKQFLRNPEIDIKSLCIEIISSTPSGAALLKDNEVNAVNFDISWQFSELHNHVVVVVLRFFVFDVEIYEFCYSS